MKLYVSFILIYTHISSLQFSYHRIANCLILFIYIYLGDTIVPENIEDPNSDASAIDIGKI